MKIKKKIETTKQITQGLSVSAAASLGRGCGPGHGADPAGAPWSGYPEAPSAGKGMGSEGTFPSPGAAGSRCPGYPEPGVAASREPPGNARGQRGGPFPRERRLPSPRASPELLAAPSSAPPRRCPALPFAPLLRGLPQGVQPPRAAPSAHGRSRHAC